MSTDSGMVFIAIVCVRECVFLVPSCKCRRSQKSASRQLAQSCLYMNTTPGSAAHSWLVLVLGWCMGSALGGALSEPALCGVCKRTPVHPPPPHGQMWPPSACLAPLGVLTGCIENKGPRARGFAGILKLALMFV